MFNIFCRRRRNLKAHQTLESKKKASPSRKSRSISRSKTKSRCQKWCEGSRETNFKTGRKISRKGKVYANLLRECGCGDKDRLKRKSSSPKRSRSKSRRKSPPKESQSECQRWCEGSRSTNFKTGRTISRKGKVYANLLRECECDGGGMSDGILNFMAFPPKSSPPPKISKSRASCLLAASRSRSVSKSSSPTGLLKTIVGPSGQMVTLPIPKAYFRQKIDVRKMEPMTLLAHDIALGDPCMVENSVEDFLVENFPATNVHISKASVQVILSKDGKKCVTVHDWSNSVHWISYVKETGSTVLMFLSIVQGKDDYHLNSLIVDGLTKTAYVFEPRGTPSVIVNKNLSGWLKTHDITLDSSKEYPRHGSQMSTYLCASFSFYRLCVHWLNPGVSLADQHAAVNLKFVQRFLIWVGQTKPSMQSCTIKMHVVQAGKALDWSKGQTAQEVVASLHKRALLLLQNPVMQRRYIRLEHLLY